MNNGTVLKKLIFFTAFVCVLGAAHQGHAQTIAPRDMEKLQIMEDSLLTTSDSMYEAYIPDTRVGYAERFVKQLIRTLKIPNSCLYQFPKLKDKINIIYADDNAFRVFNWVIDRSEISKRYYGAIQLPSEKLKLYGLVDCSEQQIRGVEDSVFTGGKWFGALYYRIMGTEVQGHKVYTMFGLNTGNVASNRKVLDPLTITENGVVFGAPVFGIGSKNLPRQPISRFILEYKKGVAVKLNWDNERNLIIFDNLASQINDPNRKYTYVPTGQYDGLRWGGNEMWEYIPNLIPITELNDGEAPTDEPPKNR